MSESKKHIYFYRILRRTTSINKWKQIYDLTLEIKTRFSQSFPLQFPLTLFHTLRGTRNKKASPQKKTAFKLSLSPRTVKPKETWSVQGFMVGEVSILIYHTKDFLQWKKPQFRPKMVGFQTILGLNVVVVKIILWGVCFSMNKSNWISVDTTELGNGLYIMGFVSA